MSFYRNFLTAMAAMSLAGAVFAADTVPSTPAHPVTHGVAKSTTSTEATQEKVNINKAAVKDLAQVKGMSMSKARAIVAYRKKHGEFKSLDDLKDVKGFKRLNEQGLKEIQDQLTIG
jgi:competence ComEA-like helix-hairpin-helix protein